MSFETDPSIASLRNEYKLKTLSEADVSAHAIEQFARWFSEARNSHLHEVSSMTLATAALDGTPSARVVLLKGFDARGFIFYTNYNSAKGKELAHNPKAALLFFWKELERQIRIEGIAAKLSAAESDVYFNSRPLGSKLGAWASEQSSVIADRKILEDNLLQYEQQFGNNVPRLAHWGGYLVQPLKIEFWQGRTNRLHDRILYTLQSDGSWMKERLAP
jgi:pyridoxamine 5'-phosphate oxidase